tara:strand:+ start:267 stop:368 length:102 start_codon:yes stop_codon:yes gene_type:complete
MCLYIRRANPEELFEIVHPFQKREDQILLIFID